jgi:hypothetical protein
MRADPHIRQRGAAVSSSGARLRSVSLHRRTARNGTADARRCCVQEGARADMTFEERCRQADKRRLAGNELFKAGQIEEADSKYTIVRVPHPRLSPLRRT